jgi:hypothetical protein
MSSQEFGHWKARAAQRGPLGLERSDYQAAQITTMLGNIHRNKDVHPEPFRVRDFLPFSRPDPVEEQRSLSSRIRGAFQSFLGRRKDKKG